MQMKDLLWDRDSNRLFFHKKSDSLFLITFNRENVVAEHFQIILIYYVIMLLLKSLGFS